MSNLLGKQITQQTFFTIIKNNTRQGDLTNDLMYDMTCKTLLKIKPMQG